MIFGESVYLKEVLDRTQCVRSATLLTVHTLCTKTLLTVHSLINYMFWESCHSCQSCQRSVVFHYLFTLYSLLYCSMLGRRAYVRCWRRCHAHWGGQGWDQHQLPRGQWGAYVPCYAHWGGLWWTKTNFLEVNSTNFLDVYDELFKVLWIESFIVFVLTSVHQVKGR